MYGTGFLVLCVCVGGGGGGGARLRSCRGADAEFRSDWEKGWREERREREKKERTGRGETRRARAV
jgi:hypothetical protein